ncbi:MAG: riboflavin biosynthesis protein RibF [bacterium (Candidatus Stahlbacteria) CG23_combo_of_CG06-09_8_20_14_all_34_7]|nr:MAG: riboflavin biosynthesis protein RibF [bacterium (Candidatus Stahlbacteria) CG23_combo_of_CG06-09_8_20_14_all_34_7]
MNIYYGLGSFKKLKKNLVVTIGSFDGLHKGHIKVLERVFAVSRENSSENCVITFEPHPRILLSEIKENFLLSTLQEKIYLLESTNLVDNILAIPFDKSFSQISSVDFIESIILKNCTPNSIIVGYDTHFGKDRMGDVTLLKKILLDYKTKIQIIEPEIVNGQVISSSIIRKYIKFGEVTMANELLGYKYFLQGQVVRGEGRGAILGFPTANIEFTDKIKILPQNGVYAVSVNYDNKGYRGMMNIGKRPTFEESLSMEVHIIDFNDNLYNKMLKISLIKRLRDEVKFKSSADLVKQLKKDKEEIKNLKEALWH